MWRLCSQQRIWSQFLKKRGLNRKASPPVHDDLVQRDFTAQRANQLWLTDITEHWTGWVLVNVATLSGRRKQERAVRLARGSKTDTTGVGATPPSTRSALSSSNCNTRHNRQRSLSPLNPVSTNRGQGHADPERD